jgi:hypothetical protein
MSDFQHIRSPHGHLDPAAERGGAPMARRECHLRALAMGPRRAVRRGPLRPRSDHRDRTGRFRGHPLIGRPSPGASRMRRGCGVAACRSTRSAGSRRRSIPLPREILNGYRPSGLAAAALLRQRQARLVLVPAQPPGHRHPHRRVRMSASPVGRSPAGLVAFTATSQGKIEVRHG